LLNETTGALHGAREPTTSTLLMRCHKTSRTSTNWEILKIHWLLTYISFQCIHAHHLLAFMFTLKIKLTAVLLIQHLLITFWWQVLFNV